MSELHASVTNRPDSYFDLYRLEAVCTDLRGHHPDELDFDRILKCAQILNGIASEILETRKEVA